MKTVATWLGALIFGFIGGMAAQRFSNWQTMSTKLTFSTKAHTFELVDRSGRVVSQWTTDQWGRPLLQFSDAKREGRIVIGPLEQADMVTNVPPDPNGAWGIKITAPGHVAHAALGTTVDATTKKPTGFANWR